MKVKASTRKTLSVSEETYNRLMEYGEFRMSFDDLINKLMDKAHKLRSETK
jgi:predicted CopG family antitoxin